MEAAGARAAGRGGRRTPISDEEQRVSDIPPHQLTDTEIGLLSRAEHGHTFRASDATGDGFAALVDGLRSLRDRGLVRLDEGRIMTSERGGYLLAGPCDLTEAGRQ